MWNLRRNRRWWKKRTRPKNAISMFCVFLLSHCPCAMMRNSQLNASFVGSCLFYYYFFRSSYCESLHVCEGEKAIEKKQREYPQVILLFFLLRKMFDTVLFYLLSSIVLFDDKGNDRTPNTHEQCAKRTHTQMRRSERAHTHTHQQRNELP